MSKSCLSLLYQKLLFKHTENQEDALSTRRIDLVKEHYNIIKYFRKIGLYNRSICFYNSLTFMIVVGILNGILGFLLLRKLHIVPRIVFAIMFTFATWIFIRSKLRLKHYSKDVMEKSISIISKKMIN